MYNIHDNDYLMHYGVKGMKWGVRKAARANAQKAYKETLSSTSRIGNSHYTRVRKAKKAGQQAYKETIKAERAAAKAERNTPEAKAARKEKAIKAAKIGAAVAGTVLAAYGAKKASDYIKSEAGKRSYESGKKYAQDHFFSKADKAGKMGDWSRKESLWQAGRQTLENTDRRTNKVQNSTVEAIKYLRHPERYLVDGDLLKWY